MNHFNPLAGKKLTDITEYRHNHYVVDDKRVTTTVAWMGDTAVFDTGRFGGFVSRVSDDVRVIEEQLECYVKDDLQKLMDQPQLEATDMSFAGPGQNAQAALDSFFKDAGAKPVKYPTFTVPDLNLLTKH